MLAVEQNKVAAEQMKGVFDRVLRNKARDESSVEANMPHRQKKGRPGLRPCRRFIIESPH